MVEEAERLDKVIGAFHRFKREILAIAMPWAYSGIVPPSVVYALLGLKLMAQQILDVWEQVHFDSPITDATELLVWAELELSEPWGSQVLDQAEPPDWEE